MMRNRNTLVGPLLQGGKTGLTPGCNRLRAFVAMLGSGALTGVVTQLLLSRQGFTAAQAASLGWLCTLAVWGLLLLFLRASFRVNPYLHGSARWAGKQDIQAAGLLSGNGVYVGAWRDKGGKIRYLRHGGPEHVLCYAPTRSGKGVGLILPTRSRGGRASS
jgi:hypothetical protein